MPTPEPAVLRFGDFEAQPHTGRLLRRGQRVAIEPRAFELLVLLAGSGGRLISKDEIVEEVWGGAFVSDNALTRAVARLRRCLGDSAREPRFVETVHARGYRFLAPVEVAPIDAGAALGADGRRWVPPRWAAAALGLVAVSVAAVVLWGVLGRPGPPADERLDPMRIAVLPLENLSGERGDDYFVNGLTEQIISNLAQIEGLRVLARTTTGGYRDNPGRIAQIARELEAGTVLEGSARRSDETLRIHIQLVDGISEEHLWSGEFDRSLDDVFVIQSEIAARVAEALHLAITSDRLARISRGPTRDPSAFDFYLRGRSAYRRQTRVGNEEAIEFYRRALELDADFALAEAGLANAFAQRVMRFGQGLENEVLAEEAARRALELNPELPEAFKALGILAMRRDRFSEAVEWNRRALELNPSYDEAIYNLSSALHTSGRWDEALRIQLRETRIRGGLPAVAAQLLRLGFSEHGASVAEAALRSEPLSPYLTHQLARFHLRQGDFESARRRAVSLRRAHPAWAASFTVAGDIEWLAGDYEAAEAFYEEAHQVWGEDEPEPLINLARCRWIRGEREAAEALFAEIEGQLVPMIEAGSEYWVHYWAMAAIASMRGQRAEALEWYRRAVDVGHRSEWPDAVDPTFAALHDAPEFAAQLERIRRSVGKMRESLRAELDASIEQLLGA